MKTKTGKLQLIRDIKAWITGDAYFYNFGHLTNNNTPF